MTNKDPIVQAERVERLRKIKDLAQKVHANRDRIRRNIETIDRAGEDNKAAAIELESDTHMLISAATNAGLGSRKDSDTVDVLLGLLVELPMQAPFTTPCGRLSGYGVPLIAPGVLGVDIETIGGLALDEHAARIGVATNMRLEFTRGSGESDAAYRDRIRSLLS